MKKTKKFDSILIKYLEFRLMLNNRYFVFGFILVLLISAAFPWSVAQGIGNTLNLYDLAEWASLHPVVRIESPTLLTALCLRLCILWFAVLTALSHVPAILRLVTVLLVSLALLPPFEFLSNINDPNYQQLFLVSVSTLLIGIGIILLLDKLDDYWRAWLIFLVGFAGLASVVIGITRAIPLMHDLQISVYIGFGAALYGINTALITWSAWQQMRTTKRKTGRTNMRVLFL